MLGGCPSAGGAGAVAGASSEPAVREACVKLPASFRQTGGCKDHPRAQSIRHLAVAHQSLPNSAESAHFSRVCPTPQSLPILAKSFSFQRSLPISAKSTHRCKVHPSYCRERQSDNPTSFFSTAWRRAWKENPLTAPAHKKRRAQYDIQKARL